MALGNIVGVFFLWLAGLIAIIYFFSVRPNKKRNEQLNSMRDAISAGDEIRTVGGIYGKVTKKAKDRVWVEVDEKTGTTIQITTIAIAEKIAKQTAEEEAEEDFDEDDE